jgi:branched-chain amino acid transport system permease protein
MEAASLRPTPALRLGRRTLAVAQRFLSRYGLILVLLILPVAYGIADLRDQGDLSRLANNLEDGLSNGAIWALVALGYTLVYGIIELINFAHGDVFMIGSFTAAGFYGTVGLTLTTGPLGLVGGLLVTALVAMIACGSLNTMIERVAYRPLRNAPKLAPLITAVGFSFILQNVGLLWLGGAQHAAPDLIQSQKELVDLAGISISQGDVLSAPSSRTAGWGRRCAPRRRIPRPPG